MTPPEPELTSREIARHLDANTDAMRDLSTAIADLRREIGETYVRKDVWLATRKTDADATLVLSEQVRSLVSLRDWTVKIIVGAVLLALLGLVIVSNPGGPV